MESFNNQPFSSEQYTGRLNNQEKMEFVSKMTEKVLISRYFCSGKIFQSSRLKINEPSHQGYK